MIEFIYIRDRNRNPVGCLAYEINREPPNPVDNHFYFSSSWVKYGISVCHEKDTFNKSDAKDFAQQRMKYVFYFKNKDAKISDILQGLGHQLIADIEHLPRRIRKIMEYNRDHTDSETGVFTARDFNIGEYHIENCNEIITYNDGIDKFWMNFEDKGFYISYYNERFYLKTNADSIFEIYSNLEEAIREMCELNKNTFEK